MLLLAIASYQYVETPVRRSEWSVVRWHSIAYGISAAMLAAEMLKRDALRLERAMKRHQCCTDDGNGERGKGAGERDLR